MPLSPSPHQILVTRLAAAGVDHPERDLERIREHCRDDDTLYETLIARRLNREPLERIFGSVEFYGLDFKMDESVFKPGFETETTAEYGLLHLKDRQDPVRILDLGTGTGCILLTLLHHLPHATGLGVDINDRALTLARENAETHSLTDRAEFRRNNWLEGLEEKFDLVISNPPRIPTNAIPHLVREVSNYDPKEALDGGVTGIEFYQRTARDFRRIAAPDALGVVQVGGIVADQALLHFRKAGYASAEIKRDYKMSPNSLIFRNDPVRQSLWSRLFRTTRPL